MMKSKKLKGWHWALIVVGALVLIFAVVGIFFLSQWRIGF